MKVVILAGGKGTRITSVSSEIPKAMIPIAGKPVLEYQVELAKRYGFTDFIFITGHLGQIIQNHFGDGSNFGVSISYFEETSPLGTAGALPYLKDQLTEDFFVFYGDTIMDIALDQFLTFHKQNQSKASLFLHPNDHPSDSDLVAIDKNKKITNFFSKPHSSDFVGRNLVNAALYILSPDIISYIPTGKSSDFGKHIFPTCLSESLQLFGYISAEYIKDMGTPERYASVCNDVISGKVTRLNNKFKRKAIFLDRDGVINEEVDLLCNPTQLKLIQGASEAIRNINQSGNLAIIITNQPVIARNLCTLEQLDLIHQTLETMLGKDHAWVDAIYYCPHHPDGGYAEERKEYKTNCECRKPKPGMILQAASDWNIDISKSIIIGDRKSDIEAGKAAGLKQCYQIPQNENNALKNLVQKILI